MGPPASQTTPRSPFSQHTHTHTHNHTHPTHSYLHWSSPRRPGLGRGLEPLGRREAFGCGLGRGRRWAGVSGAATTAQAA